LNYPALKLLACDKEKTVHVVKSIIDSIAQSRGETNSSDNDSFVFCTPLLCDFTDNNKTQLKNILAQSSFQDQRQGSDDEVVDAASVEHDNRVKRLQRILTGSSEVPFLYQDDKPRRRIQTSFFNASGGLNDGLHSTAAVRGGDDSSSAESSASSSSDDE
jgi:hypothetical protein